MSDDDRLRALLDVEVPTAGRWTAVEVPDPDAVAVDLADADLTVLEAAAVELAVRGVDPVDAGPDDLPLGPLAAIVDEVRHVVLQGRGLVLLRGLPVDRPGARSSIRRRGVADDKAMGASGARFISCSPRAAGRA